jgi:hypothetical protein
VAVVRFTPRATVQEVGLFFVVMRTFSRCRRQTETHRLLGQEERLCPLRRCACGLPGHGKRQGVAASVPSPVQVLT